MAKVVKLNGGPMHRQRQMISDDSREVHYTKIGVGQRLLSAQDLEGPVSRMVGRYVKSDRKLMNGIEVWQWMGWRN